MIPDGIKCSTYFWSPTQTVWPALAPPWHRAITSASAASRSTIFPFPSSPHWQPIMTLFLPIAYSPFNGGSSRDQVVNRPDQFVFANPGDRRGRNRRDQKFTFNRVYFRGHLCAVYFVALGDH